MCSYVTKGGGLCCTIKVDCLQLAVRPGVSECYVGGLGTGRVVPAWEETALECIAWSVEYLTSGCLSQMISLLHALAAVKASAEPQNIIMAACTSTAKYLLSPMSGSEDFT